MSSVYLDHQATTPADPRVVAAMAPYWSDCFGNPHANTYSRGLTSRRAVEAGRRKLAAAVRASARDVVFTSGATEANNLAILGTAHAAAKSKQRIITQATEHSSVLEPIAEAARQGFDVVTVGVHRDGLVKLDELAAALDRSTLLVSVMLVNNETGVLQPVGKIVELCQRVGARVHTDCAQALGKVSVDVGALGVDMASFSSHKAYGPKGIGALFVRRLRTAKIRPITFGGGQEGGLRPGTIPVPLCVGFGEAAQIASHELRDSNERVALLEARLWRGIRQAAPKVQRNGSTDNRAPGSLSLRIPGTSADALIDSLAGIDIAKGSACEATKTRGSHVLRAMGIPTTHAAETIRLSIGRFTSKDEIDRVISAMARLRSSAMGGRIA